MSERSDYIRKRVRTALDEFTSEALYWEDLPDIEYGPTWFELRDAIVSELFEMDAVQREYFRHAEWVRKNCV